MNLRRGWFFITIVVVMWSCASDSDDEGISVFSSSYDFAVSRSDWKGDFADYKTTDSISCELLFAYDTLPTTLEANKKALKLSGNNKQGNLFMFLKKKVSGLNPDTDYTIVFDIQLASNAHIGDEKAENVYLKVGGSTTEPIKVIQNGYYRMNIDKGTGGTGGVDMVVIGTIGVSTANSAYDYLSKENAISSNVPFFKARTNAQGEIWLIIGTDSLYKGQTTLFYTNVNVVFSVPNKN